MKKLLLVLLFVGLLFAQGAQKLTDAMNDLQNTTQSFIAMMVMLLILVAGPLGLVTAFTALIYFLMVRGKKKPGIWKTAMLLFGALTLLALIGAGVGSVIYVLLPALSQSAGP